MIVKSPILYLELNFHYACGILVPVRMRAGVAVKRTMYQRKVDADMMNAVKLTDVSSVSPSSEQSVSQHTIYGVRHIHINLTLIQCTFHCACLLQTGYRINIKLCTKQT